MFTGIIQSVGSLRRVERRAASAVLDVICPFTALELGESIAVDGVCLTVTHILDGAFRADASVETLARTTLADATTGRAVNLERALRLGDRLGGHIVAGHVDGIGTVSARTRIDGADRVTVTCPTEVAPFLAEKGSITIDGVSLTVNRVGPTDFDVMLVAFTQGATTLEHAAPGRRVNLEVDVLARYVARALSYRPGAPVAKDESQLLETLGRAGFL